MDTSSPEPIVDTRNASDSCANLITRAVDDLAPGGSVLLVADHNPIALRYMLEAEHPSEFGWQPVEDGPGTWRVRVSRLPA